MSDEYRLPGQHIRVLWRDLKPKPEGKPENTILRGQVLAENEHGLWVWGRFFLERMDTMSLREIPRENENEFKMYFCPWGSVDVIQIIQPNTRDSEVHNLILNRTSEEGPRDKELRAMLPPARKR